MKAFFKPIPVEITCQCGPEMLSRLRMRHHEIASDEVANMGGTDSAPAPLEYFLASLLACTNAIMRRIADQDGIRIDETDIDLKTHLDPAGVWSPVEGWHPFPEITLRVRVKGPSSEEELLRLMKKVNRGCPVQVILRRSGSVIHDDWQLVEA